MQEYHVGDRVYLTFSEALGETGVVVETGVETFTEGYIKSYDYVDVRLDTGERTGRIPSTLVALEIYG